MLRTDDRGEPPRRRERTVAFRLGLSAETRAAALLLVKGFRIVARRWRSPVGEIDLVVRRGRLLVFVEVKARGAFDDAAEAVTERQRRRIAAAAEAWLASHATTLTATSGSTPCWSPRGVSRATSRRRSTSRELLQTPDVADRLLNGGDRVDRAGGGLLHSHRDCERVG
jgi:putative endonuclease